MSKYAGIVPVVVILLLSGVVGVRDAAAQAYETRRSSGTVSFDVTPREPTEGHFVFEIVANTHSGDLAEIDLAEAVALEIDGESRRPVAATALSGHHATALVTFEMAEVPEAFALTITGVRDLGDLRFEWP